MECPHDTVIRDGRGFFGNGYDLSSTKPSTPFCGTGANGMKKIGQEQRQNVACSGCNRRTNSGQRQESIYNSGQESRYNSGHESSYNSGQESRYISGQESSYNSGQKSRYISGQESSYNSIQEISYIGGGAYTGDNRVDRLNHELRRGVGREDRRLHWNAGNADRQLIASETQRR